jgi:hypothetical protein
MLWLTVPVVAFLPLTAGPKVRASGGLVVAAEAVSWISALLFGREAVSALPTPPRPEERGSVSPMSDETLRASV